MAVVAQISSSLSFFARDATVISSSAVPVQLPFSNLAQTKAAFTTGSPLSLTRTYKGKLANKAATLTVKCEQSTQGGNSVDVWLGRLAMIGFAVAISVEVTTGKGLLENFGLTSPLPTVALSVTTLVGVLTAIFIFQSASKD